MRDKKVCKQFWYNLCKVSLKVELELTSKCFVINCTRHNLLPYLASLTTALCQHVHWNGALNLPKCRRGRSVYKTSPREHPSQAEFCFLFNYIICIFLIQHLIMMRLSYSLPFSLLHHHSSPCIFSPASSRNIFRARLYCNYIKILY